MKAFPIVLGAALLCASSALAADFDAWINGLSQGGWTMIAFNPPDKQAIFVNAPTATPDGGRTTWVRYEYMEPKPFGSIAALDNVDCAQKRIQRIKAVGYAKNNLTGESVAQPGEADWLSAPAGSPREKEIQRACAVAARRE